MTASIRLAAASNGSVSNPASVSMALLATDYLVVQLAVKDGSDPAIALVVPTVGGVSMTALGSEYTGTGGARRFTRLYGYTPPSDGTYTVSGSISQNFYFKGLQAFAWQGATASPISGIVGSSSSGTDQTWTVSSAVGDVVAAHITSQNTNTVTAGSGSTLVSGSGLGAGQYETGLTEAGAASVTINGTTASATDSWGLAYSVASASAAPVLTAPTGAATGPTQATIGITSDTTGSISSLILPAATAAPADAATLIANGSAVVRTIAAAGTPQTFPITGLTTNTAVRVHWAMADSNVVSSAAFTPNTLAISGTALSAQTGTAGAAFTWAGATPESLITNTGNGSGAWTATAGVGASGVTVNSSTGILVAGSLGTAGSYTITLQRADGSAVPGAQTVTKTVGLTISASGDVTPPTLTSPAATGGSLTCSGSVTTNEANGTLYTVFCASATPPTALQVEAGQDSAGAAAPRAVSQAVSATGSQPVVSGTITAGTRYAYFMHKDAAGNRSAVAASGSFTVTSPTTYGFSCGPFGLNTGSGPVLGIAVSYTLTPGEVGAASGASINGTGTLHASTGLLTVIGLVAAGLYSVQIKNADGSGRWHGTATAA